MNLIVLAFSFETVMKEERERKREREREV